MNKLTNLLIVLISIIALTSIVAAVPLSDQQRGGFLQKMNIINAPPTYTINDIYYYQDVGNCKANTKCSYLYAGIPAVIYIWVDSTTNWMPYNLYGTETQVKILSRYTNSIWGEGKATFLDEKTYIKVPVLVYIPVGDVGQGFGIVVQYTTDAGGNIHTYPSQDFYIMDDSVAIRTIQKVPDGTEIKPRPGDRLTPRCEEIFATYLNAVRAADTDKDNKISDVELMMYMDSYFNLINSMIKPDELQAVIDSWTNDCTIPGADTPYGDPQCSDGTLYGQCSTQKPFFCYYGTMVIKAQTCGCPSGQTPSGDNCVTTEQKCSDGTAYNTCSVNKPKYCYYGTFTNKASTCGCPSGQTPSGDICIETLTPIATTQPPTQTTPPTSPCLTGYVYDSSTDKCVKIQTQTPGFDSTLAIIAIVGIIATVYIVLRRKK